MYSPRDSITLSEDGQGVSNHLRNAKYWIPKVDTVPPKMRRFCSIFVYWCVELLYLFQSIIFFDIGPGSKRGNRYMLTQGDGGSH